MGGKDYKPASGDWLTEEEAPAPEAQAPQVSNSQRQGALPPWTQRGERQTISESADQHDADSLDPLDIDETGGSSRCADLRQVATQSVRHAAVSQSDPKSQ